MMRIVVEIETDANDIDVGRLVSDFLEVISEKLYTEITDNRGTTAKAKAFRVCDDGERETFYEEDIPA